MCVAPLVDDAEVRQFVCQTFAAAAMALVERRFQDGISAGEIPTTDFPVRHRRYEPQVIDLVRLV